MTHSILGQGPCLCLSKNSTFFWIGSRGLQQQTTSIFQYNNSYLDLVQNNKGIISLSVHEHKLTNLVDIKKNEETKLALPHLHNFVLSLFELHSTFFLEGKK